VIAEALFQSWKLIQHRSRGIQTHLNLVNLGSDHRSDVDVVERHVLLVCNSSPHETPCRTTENTAWNGFELAEKLAKENILLSVICPRAIPKLKEIFVKVSY